MDTVTLVGLVKIELPTKTLLLCDGGFLDVGDDEYSSVDDEYGTIESLQSLEEGVGDEVPAGRLSFLPISTNVAAIISAPGAQGSRMRFFIAEVNEQTGQIIGEPDLLADMQLDRAAFRSGKGVRKLDMDFVSRLERLFAINEGNTLSSRFHKFVWPNETGEDNATGLTVQVAWGTNAPPRGSVNAFGGNAPGWGGDFLQDFMNGA